MREKQKYIKAIMGTLGSITLATGLASIKLLERVVHPKTTPIDISFKQLQGNKPLFQYISQLEKERFTLESQTNERLNGIIFKQDNVEEYSPNKVVILLHGVTVNMYTSYKYIPAFYKEGYHVVCYDHAHHGLSSGQITTLGYRESDDVIQMIDYCKKRFGESCVIGLHGESMGASTAMMTLDKSSQIDFMVEDCGFSSMKDQLKYRLKVEYGLPSFPILLWTRLLLKYWYHVDMNHHTPLEAVKKATIPTLFIHGGADDYVPTQMSHQLYKAKKGKKKLVIFEGAAHARSVHDYPNAYEQVIRNFLKEYGF